MARWLVELYQKHPFGRSVLMKDGDGEGGGGGGGAVDSSGEGDAGGDGAGGGDTGGGSEGTAAEGGGDDIWSRASDTEPTAEDLNPAKPGETYDYSSDPLKLGEIKPDGGITLAGKYKGETALDAVKQLEKGYTELAKKLGTKGNVPDKYDLGKLEGLIQGDRGAAQITKEFAERNFSQEQADWIMDRMVELSRPPSSEDLLNGLKDIWQTDDQGALQRIRANDVYWRASLGADNWDHLKKSLAAQTPEGFQVLDSLRQASAGKQLWDDEQTRNNQVFSKEELQEMQAELASMNPGDPGFSSLQRKIRAGFSALYGDAPVLEIGG